MNDTYEHKYLKYKSLYLHLKHNDRIYFHLPKDKQIITDNIEISLAKKQIEYIETQLEELKNANPEVFAKLVEMLKKDLKQAIYMMIEIISNRTKTPELKIIYENLLTDPLYILNSSNNNLAISVVNRNI
jgi:hypothetical protein